MHSPEPWTVGVSLDRDNEDWPVYRILNMNDPFDKKEIEANRAMIEATPKLLKACQDVDRDYGSLGGMGTLPQPLIKRVRAAINDAIYPPPPPERTV